MADKIMTITTPIATTAGVQIVLSQSTTGIVCAVSYDPGGSLPPQGTQYSESDLRGAPQAIKDAIATLFSQIVPNAAKRMGF